MRQFFSSVAAASLVLASTASLASAPAAPPAATQARAGAEMQDPSRIEGSWWIIGLAIVAAIILLLVLLGDDDEDAPVSP